MSIGGTRDLDEIVYTSRFGRWDDRASVRVKPRRVLHEAAGGHFFPVGLVPIATHPRTLALGSHAVDDMLAHRLVQYLDFTADLEQRLVNPMCVAISRNQTGLSLPHAMRADAFKIYTDEAYHAQAAYDLRCQVLCSAGVADLNHVPAVVHRSLEAIREEPEAARGLGGLFFAICSETLISAILSDIPSDPTVVPAIRELVSDHAVDEGVHHAYFAKLLEHTWMQLSDRQRIAIARQLPKYIRALLDPDIAGFAAILADAGLDRDDIGQVLFDTYTTVAIETAVRRDACKTLRHLARVGVFELPGAMDAFAEAGLA